eukprot:5575289-Lingulodinium_polyedra.AAC.1
MGWAWWNQSGVDEACSSKVPRPETGGMGAPQPGHQSVREALVASRPTRGLAVGGGLFARPAVCRTPGN